MLARRSYLLSIHVTYWPLLQATHNLYNVRVGDFSDLVRAHNWHPAASHWVMGHAGCLSKYDLSSAHISSLHSLPFGKLIQLTRSNSL